MAGSNPNNNGFTGKDTTGFVDQEATSSLDSLRKEAMSVEWTDEKHSLYLESMEASFVDQLYNSMNFLGWQWQKEHRSAAISSMHMKSRSSGQFKVHQDGSWQRINFERGEHLLEEADGRDILLANPWIRHFRGGCRQDVPFATYQQNIASRSQQVSYGRKKELACGLVNKSELFPVCSHHQYPLNSNEEVSDQNFVDEDDEERKDHHIHRTKRRKQSV
ncbi:hypothetical protein Nepgr_005873 [Nepenthes gracilis]|uniref:Uncharacterized protein n=1 Tax=Nepenthes gracilis TaxID=150966 RepID=A0AAD3XGT1_NEPGR|nr:hypothetical protein Nepgr_005873 [Nepenthes gracilis]